MSVLLLVLVRVVFVAGDGLAVGVAVGIDIAVVVGVIAGVDVVLVSCVLFVVVAWVWRWRCLM